MVDAATRGGKYLEVDKNPAPTTMTTIIDMDYSSNFIDQYGTFRVYLRARILVDNAGANTQLQLLNGDTSAVGFITNSAVRADGTVLQGALWTLLDLGLVTFPRRAISTTFAAQDFRLRLQGRGHNAANLKWDFDCIFMVPVDEGLLDAQLSSVSGAQDRVYSDGLDVQPQLYLTNNADVPQPEYFSTVNSHIYFRMRRNVANRWGFLKLDSTTLEHVLADTAIIRLRYYPLYALAR